MDDRDLVPRMFLLDPVHCPPQVCGSGTQDHDEVPVSWRGGPNGVGGASVREHYSVQLVRQGRCGRGEGTAVWGQEGVRAVVCDEPCIEGNDLAGRARVVVELEGELIGFPSDRNPAV